MRIESNRLAVYTTVYPGVEKFLTAWYQSVLAQTDKNFDLWVGVDSLNPQRVIETLRAGAHAIHLITAAGSPAEIRQKAIEALVDEYSELVFVDSDDLLYPTRIEAARKALTRHDAVACALRIIDEEGRDLGITFGEACEQNPGLLLPRYNVFGLSNTAYRTSVLRRCIPLPDQCQLVDWLLATRAWANGADLYFDREPQMAYRQYHANVARVLPPFSAQQVVDATRRVVSHYRCALTSERPINGKCGDALREAYVRAMVFENAITESVATLDCYVDELNRQTPRYIWWWCVAHPDLEHIWRN